MPCLFKIAVWQSWQLSQTECAFREKLRSQRSIWYSIRLYLFIKSLHSRQHTRETGICWQGHPRVSVPQNRYKKSHHRHGACSKETEKAGKNWVLMLDRHQQEQRWERLSRKKMPGTLRQEKAESNEMDRDKASMRTRMQKPSRWVCEHHRPHPGLWCCTSHLTTSTDYVPFGPWRN